MDVRTAHRALRSSRAGGGFRAPVSIPSGSVVSDRLPAPMRRSVVSSATNRSTARSDQRTGRIARVRTRPLSPRAARGDRVGTLSTTREAVPEDIVASPPAERDSAAPDDDTRSAELRFTSTRGASRRLYFPRPRVRPRALGTTHARLHEVSRRLRSNPRSRSGSDLGHLVRSEETMVIVITDQNTKQCQGGCLFDDIIQISALFCTQVRR